MYLVDPVVLDLTSQNTDYLASATAMRGRDIDWRLEREIQSLIKNKREELS